MSEHIPNCPEFSTAQEVEDWRKMLDAALRKIVESAPDPTPQPGETVYLRDLLKHI